jgi:hypothetical protein
MSKHAKAVPFMGHHVRRIGRGLWSVNLMGKQDDLKKTIQFLSALENATSGPLILESPSQRVKLRFLPGDKVQIVRCSVNYGPGLVGIVEEESNGGYMVRVKTKTPDGGRHAVLSSDEKEVTIWAEEVREAP